jgi:ATP-binding cassette subfamily F protein uup
LINSKSLKNFREMAATINPVILSAKNLEVKYGEQIILDDASLTIHEGDRIGLVGRNGAGKSTFLKIVSGLLTPDSGEIAKRKEAVVSFLSQEFTLDDNKTVKENILDGAAVLIQLIKQYESLPYDSHQRKTIEHKIINADGWNIDNRFDTLILSLNAPSPDRIVSNLSGGEKRRTALCRALISQPDLLILDEPTNHLDTNSIEWIENFLAGYKGTCVFVTHDRYFLDRIATRIVELSNGIFYSHEGNYTDFLINKAERMAQLETEERKRVNFLRRELEWVRRGPKARTSKSKARLDNYFEIAGQDNLEIEIDVDLVIPPPERLSKQVLELKNISIELGEKELFKNLNLKFERGRKLGIVGPNGAGKTTLLKIILGELPPTGGDRISGENTLFNYVDQSRLILNEEKTVIEEIGEGNNYLKFGSTQITVWSYLRRFLFEDDRINTKICRLSGGEKSRLTLAQILKRGGNFLILDEPTNDLDLPTLRILEEALISFDGCVVVVSHDRYFLNRVCNGILAFEDGNVHYSEGNYDEYSGKKKARISNDISMQKDEKKPVVKAKSGIMKLSWNEKKELETIENDILKAEEEVLKLEAIFSSPDFYKEKASKTKELTAQMNEAKLKVHKLYERWEELEKLKGS